MNKTENILIGQYYKLIKERKLLREELSGLPSGSIQQKKIKNSIYNYRQYREGKKIKTIYINASDIGTEREKIERRKVIEYRIGDISIEIDEISRALGEKVHDIDGFEDYKPVRKVNYDEYSMYMSHLAHEIKRLGKDRFIKEYSNVKETGIRARYLAGLLDYLTKSKRKGHNSVYIVLDPFTYQMYYTYKDNKILENSINNAIPEFLRQGLLITDIQEAVGGAFG